MLSVSGGKLRPKNVPYKANKVNIYVFRYKCVDNKWVLENSKPCADCTKLIKKMGINYVYYSVNDERGRGIERVHTHDLESDHQSLGRRCLKLKLSSC